MKYIPILTFLLLLILHLLLILAPKTQVIPGWHTDTTKIFSLWYFVSIALLLSVIGYYTLLQKNKSVSWSLFLFHLFATIPLIVYLNRNPFWFLYNDMDMYIWSFTALFLFGQISFSIYFLRQFMFCKY